MKKHLFLLWITGLSLLSVAQDKDDKPYMTKSLTNESIKNVEAETSGGSITVSGVSAAQARVEVFVWPSNLGKNASVSDQEIKKKLDEDYELTITVANNKLTVIAKPKNKMLNWKNALNISFKIYVPGNVSTELTTSGGSIHLNDLTGMQHFTTSGGSLHADKLKGNIKGRTSGGSIHVKDCDDEIDLATSGGSIEADNCTEKIRLGTSGGSLHLSNLSGNIDAVTSGGSVHGELIKGELLTHTSGGSIDLKKLSCSLETFTSGGGIDVEITELGKYVKISNSGGNINVQLPSKGIDLKVTASRIKTEKLTNFTGSVEEGEIDGKLNGGGVPVTINASSGRVNLVLK